MNSKEKIIIVGTLVLVMIMVTIDLITDSWDGVNFWHVILEGSMGAAALFGIFYVFRGSVKLKHRLEGEAEAWRAEARKTIEGLSKAIDQQLTKWNLSPAEKEVAFLLLKGLSLKEIAEIRKTSEKTARVQSIAIYSKSGLSGRSELSAFFLEDLLVPRSDNQSPLNPS